MKTIISGKLRQNSNEQFDGIIHCSLCGERCYRSEAFVPVEVFSPDYDGPQNFPQYCEECVPYAEKIVAQMSAIKGGN